MQETIIIGAGGFAREVVQLIEDINDYKPTYNILGFIDENKDNHGKIINNYYVLGDISILANFDNANVVLGVGSPKLKYKILEKIEGFKLNYPTLIHPTSVIGKHIDLGKGVIIAANNIITTNIFIKDFVTINLSCTVGHDSIIGKFTTMAPAVSVSGNVNLGDFVEVGTGVKIIPGVKIGNNSIIGAGAVVTKDLPDSCIAVGIPAKPIKFNY